MFDGNRFQGHVVGAIPHPLLFISVSGAHLYGFPSPDSDVDLRGCHVLPTRALLGLHPPKPTFNRTWAVDGVEIDLVSHDLVKYVVLLLQPHGNYLEQLFSPLVVYQSWRANRHPERAALEALHGYDTKHAAHLLRLYRMGIEILSEQVVRVRRPDAAWLREVLGGHLSGRAIPAAHGICPFHSSIEHLSPPRS